MTCKCGLSYKYWMKSMSQGCENGGCENEFNSYNNAHNIMGVKRPLKRKCDQPLLLIG